MEKVQVILEVGKESKEVADAILVLVADLKAKKALAEIAADALPKFAAAIDGIGAVGAEWKDGDKSALIAYLVSGLGAALSA